jgi:hypothetical protein
LTLVLRRKLGEEFADPNLDDISLVVVSEKETSWFYEWLELCVVVNDKLVVKGSSRRDRGHLLDGLREEVERRDFAARL